MPTSAENKDLAPEEAPGHRDGLDLALVCACMVAATLLSFAFDHFGLETCILLIYVLAVQVATLGTERRIYCLLASVAAVGLFSFFFVPPRLSFTAGDAASPMTFTVMFVVALVSSSAMAALRAETRRLRRARRRSEMLLESDRRLQGCTSAQQTIEVMGEEAARMTEHVTIWYAPQPPGDSGEFAAAAAFTPQGEHLEPRVAAPEMPPIVAGRAYVGEPVGGAEFSSEHGVYLTVRTSSLDASGPAAADVAGILAVAADEDELAVTAKNAAASIVGEASIVLGRVQALQEREAASVLAQNEKLRANLLRSISHDLRTPLTGILGNAEVLLSDDAVLDNQTRERLLHNIRDDAAWLSTTVENLLAVTRLNDAEVRLDCSIELMDDLVGEALRHASPQARNHRIEIVGSPDPAFVNVNARLVTQLLVNLINNAVEHTPEGSHIIVRTSCAGGTVRCSVEDDGPGVADEDREHIFDAFYTGGGQTPARADAHRSVGLGLSLCRSIVDAHGGTIELRQARLHGCIFEFTLPACELDQEDSHGQ